MSAAAVKVRMKETGMIFKPDSVRAIIAGTKTQTRRVIADAPEAAIRLRYEYGYLESHMDLTDEWLPVVGRHGCETMVRCPYGTRGDRIYVKESVWVYSGSNAFHYSADEAPPKGSSHFGFLWHCHQMPKDAARLWLEITNVRVEKLQEISAKDCAAEGVMLRRWLKEDAGEGLPWLDVGLEAESRELRQKFKNGWDSINAKRGYSWDSNPWVWVIEFKKL